MDPFLNLDEELDFSELEHRDLIAGRNALQNEIRNIGGEGGCNPSDEDADRYDGLCDRLEDLVDFLEDEERSQRRLERAQTLLAVGSPERRNSGRGRSGSRNSGARQSGERRGNPAAARGAEPTERDILDDLQNYRLMRAVNLVASSRPLDGFEGEVHQELEHRRGEAAQGIMVPWNLPISERRGSYPHPEAVQRGWRPEHRDVQTSDAAGLVPTIQAPTMIDVLRNRMLLVSMGATVLTGMVGDFDIPKKTATSSGYWVAEAADVTASVPTVGQVSFSPSTVGTYIDVTRRLIKQSSFDAEMIMRMDAMDAIRVELDRVGLNGSGSGAEPEGILQNSSVPTVAIDTNGGAMTWAKVVEMESEVAADNADIGNLGYLFNAKGRGHLKTVDKATGAAQFIWQPDNTVNGYRAAATNQLPSNLTKGSGTALSAGIFGNYNDAAYALWGGLDVIVDTASLSKSGGLRLVFLADADFQLRRTESFSKVVDIVTA